MSAFPNKMVLLKPYSIAMNRRQFIKSSYFFSRQIYFRNFNQTGRISSINIAKQNLLWFMLFYLPINILSSKTRH
jgi:hypothetical protein